MKIGAMPAETRELGVALGFANSPTVMVKAADAAVKGAEHGDAFLRAERARLDAEAANRPAARDAVLVKPA